MDKRVPTLEQIYNPNIFSIYPGRDFGSLRYNSEWESNNNCIQKMYNIQDITFEQVVSETIKLGASIIIETPKKDGSGKYYIKGIHLDWNFCKEQLETCKTYEIKYSKRAWLLKKIKD